MTDYIVKLTYLDGGAAGRAVRDAAKIQGALGPLEKMGGGSRRGGAGRDPAVAYLQDRQRAYKQQQKADADYTRSWEKNLAAQDRASAKAAREQLKRDKVADKAARRDYFGGEKSFGDLLRKKRSEERSGIANRVAGALTPGSIAGSIAGGAGGAAVGAVGLVADATAGIANFAYQLGSAAISAQAMRESSVEGFKAIYGTAVDADKLFDSARQAAQQTKFDTKDVVKIYNTLAANNFAADELPKYFNAVADIESAREGKGEIFLNAISKIRGNKTASFGQVQSAGLQGAGIENVFNELAQTKGIKKSMTRKDWMKLFKDGAVTREEALQAVTQSVAKKYDTKTGELGEYSQAQGGSTFAGVISNIKNAMPDILNMKLPETHAIFKFRDVLRALGSKNGLFDSTSERGIKFGNIVKEFVEDVFMPFGGMNLGKTNNIMDQLLKVAGAVELRFKSLMTDITKAVNQGLGDGTNSILSALGKIAFDIGVAVAKGMYVGLMELLPGGGRYSSVVQGSSSAAWGNLAADATTGAANYEFAPGTSLAGLWDALPSFGSGGTVPGSPGSPQLIKAHGGEVIPGLRGEYMGAAMAAYGGGGGGATMNVTIINNITGSGDPVQSAQMTSVQTEIAIERVLGRWLALGT